ncbi:MAG: hypothetical protein ACRDS9_19885 [Pseudonocardiaceae bacterium]
MIEALRAGEAHTSSSLDEILGCGPGSAALGGFLGGLDGELGRIEDREALRPLLAQLAPRDHRLDDSCLRLRRATMLVAIVPGPAGSRTAQAAGDRVARGHDLLLAALRRQHLAPFAALPATTRDRLVETLRSWLMNMATAGRWPRNCTYTPRWCATG